MQSYLQPSSALTTKPLTACNLLSKRPFSLPGYIFDGLKIIFKTWGLVQQSNRINQPLTFTLWILVASQAVIYAAAQEMSFIYRLNQ